MKKLLLLIVLFSSKAYAQNSTEIEYSLGTSEPLNRTYSAEIGRIYNKPAYYNHPDFGTLPTDAPEGKQLVEDLSKRKVDERYYIDLNQRHFFYIQKSTKPINFLKNGKYIAIEPWLKKTGFNVYKAVNQPCPTELNIPAKRSSIYANGESFSFNHYSLQVVHDDNTTNYYKTDWSDFRISGNECYISSVFPGIDMKIEYREAGVKSEFIIKENLHVKRLHFIDSLQLSDYLAMKLDGNVLEDHSKGRLIVYDKQTDDTWFEIKPARTHDASGSGGWFNPYSLSGNKLELLCDSSILNSPQTVYPVVVDPLVTAATGGTTTGTNLLGSALSPLSCSNTISVTFPGGSTPWDASPRWTVTSDYCQLTGNDCNRSQVLMLVSSACGGRSPSGASYWVCSGCNSPGAWSPTVTYGLSGTQSLMQCYPASCLNQTLFFTINITRNTCNPTSNYDGCIPVSRSFCQTLDNWSITVQGRTMETLGNTATGNGATSTSVNCSSSYTMDPAASYGISPYTYSWSTGGVGATKTVTPTVGGTINHIATVTDACGTSRTATFSVNSNCPLPVDFIAFQGNIINNQVLLNWSTASERNSNYFLIEKSGDGTTFESIGKVYASGQSTTIIHYQFTDPTLPNGQINYYRLKQFDIDSTYTLSKTIAIRAGALSENMLCVPNPVQSELEIILSETDAEGYLIELYTLQGMRALSRTFTASQTLLLNLSSFASGSYIVRAYSSDKRLIGSKIIIRE